jgi:hypothetical protein
MSERNIFRSQAIQAYEASKQRTNMPNLMSSRVFLALWLLVGLCGASGAVLCLVQVPIYLNGSIATSTTSAEQVTITLAQSSQSAKLRVGQNIELELNDSLTVQSRIENITNVTPNSTTDYSSRLQASTIGPTTLVTATLSGQPRSDQSHSDQLSKVQMATSQLPKTLPIGTTGQMIRVRVGSQSLISLFV